MDRDDVTAHISDVANNATLDALIARLRHAGETAPQDLLDRIVAQGPVVVPRLLAIATDADRLWDESDDSDAPELWAPIHAVQLLARLPAPESVEPLLSLLDVESDYFDTALPEALARIGRPALGPLRAALFDPSHDIYTTARAGTALGRLANYFPDLRAEAIEALVARLDEPDPEAEEESDYYTEADTLRGFLVGDLLDAKAVEAMPVIRRAYREDRIDRTVVSPDSVELALGQGVGESVDEAVDDILAPSPKPTYSSLMADFKLRMQYGPQAMTPSPPLLATMTGAAATDAASLPRPRYDGPKVGRNDPCPCGSGQKYKRCCGR